MGPPGITGNCRSLASLESPWTEGTVKFLETKVTPKDPRDTRDVDNYVVIDIHWDYSEPRDYRDTFPQEFGKKAFHYIPIHNIQFSILNKKTDIITFHFNSIFFSKNGMEMERKQNGKGMKKHRNQVELIFI